MSDASMSSQAASGGSPRWQPLSAIDRRVLGVLGEKAKTTPDVYPMSLNGICAGCNQKSNRDPLMQLEPEDVEESLDRLRAVGAVGLIEGSGRVSKYRHYLYDWLGVDKVEVAIMIELLLRGDQTVGELRARTSRMEPISDQNALQTVLHSLRDKKLVISLTPEGRGQVVTHALYKPRELDSLREKYSGSRPAEHAEARPEPIPRHPSLAQASSPSAETRSPSSPPSSLPRPATAPPHDAATAATLESFRRELDSLRVQVSQLQRTVEEGFGDQGRLRDELSRIKDELGI